ncbi:MAG: Na+/H+ antiporter subunit E [Desulfurivibrio sp.]|nr:Na+/H+ antiporter subunit E [Desulfurivibrio sp.]
MSAIITFAMMMGFWLVMSGKFDLFHLGMGVLASGLVSWLSHGLFFTDQPRQWRPLLTVIWRFWCYVGWLLLEVVKANFHIVGLALSPRASERLDPAIIKFHTILKSDFARFVLANSITLTPGTVTIRVQDDFFYVHAITGHSAGDLGGETPGKMERWVAWVFEEGEG